MKTPEEYQAFLRTALNNFLAVRQGDGLEPARDYLPYNAVDFAQISWLTMRDVLVKDELRELTNSLNAWLGALSLCFPPGQRRGGLLDGRGLFEAGCLCIQFLGSGFIPPCEHRSIQPSDRRSPRLSEAKHIEPPQFPPAMPKSHREETLQLVTAR